MMLGASHVRQPSSRVVACRFRLGLPVRVYLLPSPWAKLLVVAFAGPFTVGTLPLGDSFAFNGGCSRSLELDVQLSLELGCLLATFCFPHSAFAFANALLALFSFSFSFSTSFLRAAIRAFISFPLRERVVAKGYSVCSTLFLCPS